MPLHVASAPVLFAIGVALIVLAARGAVFAPAALIVLTMVDPLYYAGTFAVWGETSNIEERLAKLSVPPADSSHRLLGGNLNDIDACSLIGRPRIDGFEGLPPFKRLDYRQLNPRRVGSVGWVSPEISHLHAYEHEYSIFDTSDMSGLPESSIPGWFLVPNPLPRARMVSRVEVSDEPGQAINRIDIDTTALVETPLELAAGEPGSVEIAPIDRE